MATADESIVPVSSFNEEEMEDYLLKKGITIEVASNFKKNLVTGEAF